jgi:cytochrome-b5 reductase
MLRTSLVRHIGRQLSAQQLRLISTSHATDQVLRPSSIDGASNAANESATDGFWGAKLATFGAMVAGAAAISTTSVFSSKAACEKAVGDNGEEKVALNGKDFQSFKLKERRQVSPDTKLYRFELPEDTKVGLSIASCLVTRAKIKGDDGNEKTVVRPYTPVSDPDVKGYFDLVVKVYPQGNMSRHIDSLKPGDTLEVKGPIPKIPIKENMKMSIGMVAGGTGITPMLQVINQITKNPNDKTQVSLIYANNTEEDILLKDQLDRYAAEHPNFKVFYVVAKPKHKASWKGGVGFVSKEQVQQYLPKPADDSLIMVCGPPGFMKHISGDKKSPKDQGEVEGLLKDLGYTKDQVFKF